MVRSATGISSSIKMIFALENLLGLATIFCDRINKDSELSENVTLFPLLQQFCI